MKGRFLTVSAKCSDLCCTTLKSEDGSVIKETDGYVPHGLGIGGGDYIEFKIDLTTGQIVNWVPPAAADIEAYMDDC